MKKLLLLLFPLYAKSQDILTIKGNIDCMCIAPSHKFIVEDKSGKIDTIPVVDRWDLPSTYWFHHTVGDKNYIYDKHFKAGSKLYRQQGFIWNDYYCFKIQK